MAAADNPSDENKQKANNREMRKQYVQEVRDMMKMVRVAYNGCLLDATSSVVEVSFRCFGEYALNLLLQDRASALTNYFAAKQNGKECVVDFDIASIAKVIVDRVEKRQMEISPTTPKRSVSSVRSMSISPMLRSSETSESTSPLLKKLLSATKVNKTANRSSESMWEDFEVTLSEALPSEGNFSETTDIDAVASVEDLSESFDESFSLETDRVQGHESHFDLLHISAKEAVKVSMENQLSR